MKVHTRENGRGRLVSVVITTDEGMEATMKPQAGHRIAVVEIPQSRPTKWNEQLQDVVSNFRTSSPRARSKSSPTAKRRTRA